MTLPSPHTTNNKVLVMMSGGVDSSVTALDLKQKGYDVTGVFMKCWTLQSLTNLGVDEKLYGCFWEEDSQDARIVADTLGIDFYVWDLESDYRKSVVDYMISSYQSGITPNPDIMCNSLIKFGVFYDKAMALGVDYVATGHYARINQYESLTQGLMPLIFRGKDVNKDQSYFLSRVQPYTLTHCLFPIGEYDSKASVRLRASQSGLITASKKDSQGLCFIGETPLRELLIQTLGKKEGAIITLDGTILGTHEGAMLYTIGQRSKLGLAGGPWFVKSIDVITNTVTVVHETELSLLYSKAVNVINPHYFVNQQELIRLSESGKLQAQIRYRQLPQQCIINLNSNGFEVVFESQAKAIASGQTCALYYNDVLLASGIIS